MCPAGPPSHPIKLGFDRVFNMAILPACLLSFASLGFVSLSQLNVIVEKKHRTGGLLLLRSDILKPFFVIQPRLHCSACVTFFVFHFVLF